MATLSCYRYPGGKAKMLHILMDHLDHIINGQDSFADVFVGGGSVLLEVARKYPSIKLFCNDKDYGISSFWSIIADDNKYHLYDLLNLMQQPPTIELFNIYKELPPENKLHAAYQSIFFNRCCFSGIQMAGPIGGKKQLSKYKVDCRYNYKKLKSKILHCHDLLVGRTVVENKDFKDYLPLIDSNMPAYIDPPYLIKGDMLYQEKMTLEDHKILSEILNKRNNWVLSYDDAIEIRELYKDKRIIDLAARYSINGSKENWTSKNELIILP